MDADLHVRWYGRERLRKSPAIPTRFMPGDVRLTAAFEPEVLRMRGRERGATFASTLSSHLLAPGGTWQTLTSKPLTSANRWISTHHSRVRESHQALVITLRRRAIFLEHDPLRHAAG